MSVPSFLPDMPCASRSISLPKRETPVLFVFWALNQVAVITAAAKSVRNCSGKARNGDCLADGQLPDISIAESRSWVFDLVFSDGKLSCDIVFGVDLSLVAG